MSQGEQLTMNGWETTTLQDPCCPTPRWLNMCPLKWQMQACCEHWSTVPHVTRMFVCLHSDSALLHFAVRNQPDNTRMLFCQSTGKCTRITSKASRTQQHRNDFWRFHSAKMLTSSGRTSLESFEQKSG